MAIGIGSASDYYTIAASSDFNVPASGDFAFILIRRRTGTANSFSYGYSWGGFNTSNSINHNLNANVPGEIVYTTGGGISSFPGIWTLNQWQVEVIQPNSAGTGMEIKIADIDGTTSPTVTTVEDLTPGQIASNVSSLTGHIGGRSDQEIVRFFEGEIYLFARVNARLTDANVQSLASGDTPTDIGLSPVCELIFSSADATISDTTVNANDATRVGSPTTVSDPGFPAPSDTVAVTSIASQTSGDKIVVQRVSGSRSITFAGTYTGSPTAIEARIVNDGTDTALSGLDWQTIDGSPSSGTWSGSLTVPQGGWYNIDVRWSNDNAVTDLDTVKFGVGDVIGLYGQSQMVDFYDTVTHTPASPNALAAYRDVQGTDVFAGSPSDGHVTTFLNAIIAETSVPAAAVGGAVGGTTIAQLSKGAGNNYFEDLVAALNETGVSYVLYNQGGTDATSGTAKATYASSLSTLFSDLQSDTTDTITLGLSVLANRTTGTDANIHNIRTAQMEYLAANSSVLHLGTNQDLTNADAVHHDDAGQETAAERMALAVLNGLGVASVDARGPSVSSAYYIPAENKIRVNIAHSAGSSLSVDGGGNPTSFEFFDDGSPITPTGWAVNASNIEATFASIDDVSTYTVRVAYGARDEDLGEEVNTRDNFTTYTTVGLPLAPTNSDITATTVPTAVGGAGLGGGMFMGFGLQLVSGAGGFGASSGAVVQDTDFILVMETTSPSETVTIPAQNVGTFDAAIDWGDGSSSAITAYNDANLTHTYATAGEHTIRISGTFPNIYFNDTGDKLKVKRVEQLGDVGWVLLSSGFNGCSNMTSFVGGVTDTSSVTGMPSMFRNCSSLTTLDVTSFNTSSATSMNEMFRGCSSLTVLDVSGFDTSNVTNTSSMFNGCNSLTACDVSGFNTSNVTSMSFMFVNCGSLTALDVSGFNTSNVTSMAFFFANCASLTALDVSGFNTSNVSNMSLMFRGCSSLTSLDVSGFDTGNVDDMFAMFFSCPNLGVVNISGWNVSSVTRADDFMTGANNALDTTEYDQLLVAWEAQTVQSGVAWNFGDAQYTAGSAAETARTNLINNSSWTITDGGSI